MHRRPHFMQMFHVKRSAKSCEMFVETKRTSLFSKDKTAGKGHNNGVRHAPIERISNDRLRQPPQRPRYHVPC